MKRIAVAFALAALASSGIRAQDFLSGKGPQNPVRIDQRLKQQIPLNLEFHDESGRTVQLGEYFGQRPVVLMLVYYRCPMLCNLVLDGTTTALSNIRLNMGQAYDVVTVSFDPRDTPRDAVEKKERFVRRYGRPGAGAGWHFLTGDQNNIAALTRAVGFHYYWDQKSQQFAHAAGIMIVTPEGKLSRYFFGIQYPSRDVRLALVEASQGKIGSVTDQFLLLCFHYDPATGRYSKLAMNVVRAGGVFTVIGLAGFAWAMIRRDRRKDQRGRDR